MDLTIMDYGYVEHLTFKSFLVDLRNQERLDGMMARKPLPWILDPGARMLLGVVEEVTIPSGYVGLVELRSTCARAGLMSPPTFADPAYQGRLTLEVMNINRFHSILITPGQKLFTLVLVNAHESVPDYRGRYQGATEIETAKAFEVARND